MGDVWNVQGNKAGFCVAHECGVRSPVLAFATSTHARCGARCSPAMLSTHGSTVARLLWDLVTDTAGFFVINLTGWSMSWQPSPLCISFGLSPLLLGVTKSPRYCDQDTAVGSPLWVSPTHLIEESIDLHCKSVHLRNIANSSRVELANDILWSFQAANHRWLVLVLLHMQGHFMTIERVTNSQPVESRVELPFSHPPDYGVMHMVFAPYNPNELVVGLEKANVSGRVMFIVLDIEKTQSTGAACVLTNLCYDFVVGSPVTILPLRNRSGARSLICGLQSAMPGHLDLYNVTEGVPCVPSSQRIGSTPQMEPSRISDSMFLTWLPGPNGFRAKYQVWDCSDTRAPLREVVQPQGICLFSIIAEGGFLVRVFEHHIDVVEAMTEFPLLVMEVPERQVMNVVYHAHF